jgi:hypothetical protein
VPKGNRFGSLIQGADYSENCTHSNKALCGEAVNGLDIRFSIDTTLGAER